MAFRKARPAASPCSPDRCAELLKILADATRLGVVRRLMEHPRRAGELQALLEVEQSLLSHHLKVLREAGFVQAQRDGKSVLYRLSPMAARKRRGSAIDLGCCRLHF